MTRENHLAAFSKRLNQICDRMNVPAKGKGRTLYLGRRFKVSPTAARKWLDSTSFPSLDTLLDIALWSHTDIQWLLLGDEEDQRLKAMPERHRRAMRHADNLTPSQLEQWFEAAAKMEEQNREVMRHLGLLYDLEDKTGPDPADSKEVDP
jgi:transcriptional regulator with XRE-family HTH domain